jgi:hypothetical protein
MRWSCDFIKFKNEILRPQDDRERLNDEHQRKDNLICHSEQSKESPTFIEFLTQHITLIITLRKYLFLNL